MQATCSEPAVLHAALALGSVHRRESIVNGGNLKKEEDVPDAQEQFTLQQYNKAIHQLQPHFFARTKSSIRVALVTCVIFICLEFLRGRYDVGNRHLQNGMKLLNEIAVDSSNRSNGTNNSSPCLEPTDDWLIEVLARLNLQAILFGQGSQRFDIIPQRFDSQPLPVIFVSMRQARTSLDRLMSRILRLTEQCRQQDLSPSCSCLTQLLDSQQCVQADLESWFQIYLVSRVHLQADKGIVGTIAYKLLRLHHTLAKVMSEVCLQPEDESCFDTHTDGFVALIRQAIDLSNTIMSTDLSNTPFDHTPGISPFVADLGWIPPLYYTAIKCRIHRIRLQAIRLLDSITSKEGIWDAVFAASIAREVMRIEEGASYGNVPLEDDFPLHSTPSRQALAVPPVPEANRIHGLRVALPINLTKKVILTGRRKQKNGSWEMLHRECDAYSQCWTRGDSG